MNHKKATIADIDELVRTRIIEDEVKKILGI